MYNIFKYALRITASIVIFTLSLHIFLPNRTAVYGYGVLQTAMGGTAVASSDNAMNMATNPASLAFGSDNWTVGMEVLVPDRKAIIGGNSLSGNRDRRFFIPEFAYQKTLNDKFALGVAVYGNSGANVFYNTAIFANPATSPDSGLDFASVFFAPSVSIKTGENSAIGVSLNLVYQRIELAGVNGLSALSTDAENLSDKGHDSATGIGFTLGWQGKLSPKVRAGVAYRAKTSMSRFDKYKGAFAEGGKFDVPSMFTLGLSVEATPKITFAVDFSHLDFSDIKFLANSNNASALIDPNTGLPIPDEVAANGFGSSNGAGFGWKDKNIIKLGVKYKLNEKITLLGGFNHGNTPINENETAFNTLAPATIEDRLTLGIDWDLAKNSSVTIQYMHGFKNKIKGSTAAGAQIQVGVDPVTSAPIFATADIEAKQDALAISYTRQF